MKKLYVLLILFLFLPIGVNALEPNYKVEGLYINADIKDNGDMLVKEQIVLNGDFNGYIRDLSYKGNYTLYDASSLEVNRVCELSLSKKGSFGIQDSELKCFNEKYYASSGDSYVYVRTNSNNMVSLKMFDYTDSGTKIFYIEYLLKDIVVIHNDVAELYWTFIGEQFDDDIADVKVTVNLPSQATDLRVWAHGPLTGNIKRENNNKIIATISNLYANNLVDVRATFDKSVVPNGTKLSNKDAFSSILAEEEQRAIKANQQRQVAKAINYGVVAINIIWIAGAIALAIYAYNKYDKERTPDFKLQYYRDFPAEYGPEVVEYLMKKSISPLSLSATILNIINKKAFSVREETGKWGKKEYILVVDKTKYLGLAADEIYVADWLVDDLGNGTEVSLDDIKHASQSYTSAHDFTEKYNEWNSGAIARSTNEEFYESALGFKIKGSLYAVLGFALFGISISQLVESLIVVLTLITSIALLVYILVFTKRTVKGNEHYAKWKAFKNFLLDFGRFGEKELPEIALWEKYLVYATALGIADKVSKAMEIKLKNMNINNEMPLYTNLYMHSYFTNNLVSTVNTVRTASISKIAESQSSSGSGFGGGFSGGGGFGGGGVSGGGHGF